MESTMLACRKICFTFGSVPIYPWLGNISSIQDLLYIKRRLLESPSGECVGKKQDSKQHDAIVWVKKEVLSRVLGCDDDQTKVLLDLLTDVSDVGCGCVCKDAAGEALFADLHRLLLLLVLHYFFRMGGGLKAAESSGDVWPDEHAAGGCKMGGGGHHYQMEPSSPLRLHQRSFAPSGRDMWLNQNQKGGGSSSGGACSGPDDCEYVVGNRRLTSFLGSHLEDLLHIIVDGENAMDRDVVMGYEIDRLGFLLEQSGESRADDMEIESGERLSRVLCMHLGDASWTWEAGVSIERVRTLLEAACRETSDAPPPGGGGHMMQEGGEQPVFNQMIGDDKSDDHPCVVRGAHKATVLRGVDECKGCHSLKIVDCHDSVIYCLAPLQWVQVLSCTNSIIIIGAVGQSLRVEHSERLQVVSVSSHIVVNTCHDCILYSATNRSPLVMGDNRFVQLAPYNSGYECLEEHMRICGISNQINKWNRPMLLMPDKPIFKQHQHGLEEQQHLDHSQNVTLLPPEKLMPFMIPFRGCQGPLCGGSATSIMRAHSDTLTGLLTQDFVDFAPCPFPLPETYSEAWKKRMGGVNTVRDAYREAKLSDAQKLEFTGAVQSYFKEWLQSGGGMREVYDLAKVEKQYKNQR
ncbi:TBCC domain-containing protein 1 [Picochlorum sp. SENEW3]|nr:TBCC domain-containing protein 1 [Picochlorum sp. SENEW3]